MRFMEDESKNSIKNILNAYLCSLQPKNKEQQASLSKLEIKCGSEYIVFRTQIRKGVERCR